jgi:hypothetical protein
MRRREQSGASHHTPPHPSRALPSDSHRAQFLAPTGLAEDRVTTRPSTRSPPYLRNSLDQNGESLDYVKEQFGRHSIQVTVDPYGHLVPGGNRQAVVRLADLPEATIRNLDAVLKRLVTAGKSL